MRDIFINLITRECNHSFMTIIPKYVIEVNRNAPGA